MTKFDQRDQEYFNQPDYVEKTMNHATKMRHMRLQHLRKVLNYRSAQNTLEVGCGGGVHGSDFNGWIGVDISIAAVRRVRDQGYPTVVSSATNLPFKDQSFEMIVSFDTMEHLYKPDEFLDECIRVCKSKGYIVIYAGQYISHVLLGNSFRELSRNFQWFSKSTVVALFRNWKTLLMELLRRNLDETKAFFDIKSNLRTVFIQPSYKGKEDNVDAVYAVNHHAICTYLRTRGCKILNLLKYPFRTFEKVTADGMMITAVKGE